MPSYLQKRRRRWYAVLEIPRKLRPAFGKPRFVQSLETDSYSEATRLVHGVIADWQRRLQVANDPSWPTVDYAPSSVRTISSRTGIAFATPMGGKAMSRPITPPAVLFDKLRAAATPEARQAILAEIDEAASYIGALSVEHVGERPSSAPEAQLFQAEATGQLVSFTEYLDEWQTASRAGGTTTKTLDMQASDVRRFAAKFPNVRDVTRPEVKRWIADLMAKESLTPKTVQRILSALRGYWRHLQAQGVAPEGDEPFSKLDVARQGGKATGDKRRPFTAAEVLQLHSAAIAGGDQQLADLIDMARWTGARIEEICALAIENVKLDAKVPHFSVTDAKTNAGVREVPIHSELAPVLRRLIDERTSGHVLTKLSPNKYGIRSNGVGNRFGRLKTAQGFGPAYVFHSIRKTVATLLENAGVPVNIAADILGHEKRGDITYGLYSGGASLAVKAEALARLTYSEP